MAQKIAVCAQLFYSKPVLYSKPCVFIIYLSGIKSDIVSDDRLYEHHEFV